MEELLLEIGEQVGFENIISASRINKAIVVFLKSDLLVNQLTVSGNLGKIYVCYGNPAFRSSYENYNFKCPAVYI